MNKRILVHLFVTVSLINVYSCATTSNSPSENNLKLVAAQPELDHNSLSKSVIRRVILARKQHYERCLEKELASREHLNGTVELKMKVSPTGWVLTAQINSTGINNADAKTCILAHVRKLRFPARESDKTIIINYPFILKEVK